MDAEAVTADADLHAVCIPARNRSHAFPRMSG